MLQWQLQAKMQVLEMMSFMRFISCGHGSGVVGAGDVLHGSECLKRKFSLCSAMSPTPCTFASKFFYFVLSTSSSCCGRPV